MGTNSGAPRRGGLGRRLYTRLYLFVPGWILTLGAGFAFGVVYGTITVRDYLFASWIGMLPGTVMYVYFGSALKSIADIVAGNFQGGVGQRVLFFIGLVATVIVTIFVTRIAKKALNQAVPSDETS